MRSVYEDFRDEILAGVKAALPLDAVLINVHGAMVADGYDDCEGDLLARDPRHRRAQGRRSAPSSTCTAI